jgi:hypothetical protein
MDKKDESLPEEWEHFEDAQQSTERRRQELIARLRARLINGQNKLSEEQVAAVVDRMADLALRSAPKNPG